MSSETVITMDISIQGHGGSIVLGAEPETAVVVLRSGDGDGMLAVQALRGRDGESTVVALTDEGRRMLIAALEKAG